MIEKVLHLVPDSKKERLLSGMLFRLLRKLKHGHLVVNYQGESNSFGQPASDTDLTAILNIHSGKALLRMVSRGSIGAGEAYMQGEWSSPNLTNLIRLSIRNMQVVDDLEEGIARVSSPVFKLLHWLKKNTLSQSRKNIAAHYDIGNDLFEHFLDPTMTLHW